VLLTDRFGARERNNEQPSNREAVMLRIALVAALVLAPAALADGGPSPGVDQGGNGVVSSSGLVRYVALPGRDSTVLEAIRTRDGHVLRWRAIRGGFGIPFVTYNGTTGGISRNGRTLVLGESSFKMPLRTVSTFQVVDPTTFGYETISLDGDFSFDAVSPDAHRLYLIQHISATNLNRYLVREYDLYADRLLPRAIADRTQRGWVMQGSPLARTTSANGRFVYTLYQNPGGYPFVHALDTARGRAHCIGLPWTGDQSIFSTMRLVLGDTGRTLALDVPWNAPKPPATLPSFRIDTRTYRVTEPHPRGGHFPWWTLGFAAPFVLLAAASRRARVTPTIASRSATAMCSSGVWISAIPFARLTHWRPRSLKTFASAAPPERP
jgi:hypothetical protein